MSNRLAARAAEHDVTPKDITNLMAGEGGVDLVPVLVDGKQTAMEIVGLRPGTTAARLGAQNGDTIESINDVPLTSVAAAYQAGYAASRQGRIVIRGERAGTAYTTVLVVRGP